MSGIEPESKGRSDLASTCLAELFIVILFRTTPKSYTRSRSSFHFRCDHFLKLSSLFDEPLKIQLESIAGQEPPKV